jgi:hypothetical protein
MASTLRRGQRSIEKSWCFLLGRFGGRELRPNEMIDAYLTSEIAIIAVAIVLQDA